jgi:exodeoxyribonuclease VII large subunit
MRPEPLLRFAPFQHTTHVFSVGELAVHVGGLLDGDPVLRDVWLRGEITNAMRSAAGHHYFTLKDDQAQLRCVLFRGNAFNSPINPTNGLAIVAHGSIQYYERQGSCELVADLLFPEGIGLAQMESERVYRRLESEGLFEMSRKRPLPRLPRRIGVVSSERGAVIHDLLSILQRRYPIAEVVFVPSPVQGPGAAPAMAQAVNRLSHWRREGAGIDVMVLARGGGSDEDLAAFNDERLAHAIFASPVPVISAVGHETNYTLCDLVADVRAPTPSAAAELLAPDISTLLADVRSLGGRARRAVDGRLADARRSVDSSARRLRALGPEATLARGYAIVQLAADASIVDDAATLAAGDRLRIRLRRGRLNSTVEAVEPEI